MRDPERINRINDLLYEIWQLDPDMRFMQFIYVLQARYSNQNQNEGLIEQVEDDGFAKRGFDLFHLEDTKFESFLKQTLENRKLNKNVSTNQP